ncbi:MAG: Ig-like domain-containing protein [Gemmatimonadales bacterium]|nr:Ig-like domain-containing protein [Gemmatimonadales bacterium]
MARGFTLAPRALALILAGVLGCGSDLLLPDPPGGENVLLSKVGGDKQDGVVGERLQEPLVVEVKTGRGLAAIEREVEFVFTDAAGVVTPSRAITNSLGEAKASWTLGSEPGPQTVMAQLVVADTLDLQTEEFTAQAAPGAPDTLSARTPTSQPGRRSREVGTQPVIQVVDRFGNPVPQVSVAWQVVSGEGEVSEAITLTDNAGTATVNWTLGGRAGLQRLTAAVGPGPVTGSPATFTATVLF